MCPRTARIELPGVPMHVTQRGVNRCAIFIDDHDRRLYRRLLRKACGDAGVLVHAYVLMGNHVHLLLAAAQSGAISRAMRRVGQAYAQTFNLRHGRCGPLWQGRFKSSPVETDRYLLNVMRYIELNPVRAALVGDPAGHAWSSFHAHGRRASDPVLSLHPLYVAVDPEPAARAAWWCRWVREGIAAGELAAIRRHVAQERVLGDERFQAMAAEALGRPVACRRPGRPIRSGDAAV